MIPDSYFSRFATQKYQNKNPIQRHLIRRFAERLHGFFVRASPVSRVLEIGCGEGFLSGYLSEHFVDVEFCGIDLNPSDVAKLKEKFPRIDARQGSIYDLSEMEATGTFDLVMCCEVLEHVDDPNRAVREIARLQAAHAIITVPHEPFFRLSNLARGKNITRLGNDIEHINHWGGSSFRRLLEPHFDVQELVTSYPWLLSYSSTRSA